MNMVAEGPSVFRDVDKVVVKNKSYQELESSIQRVG